MRNSKWTNKSHNILEEATSLSRYNRWLINNFQPYFNGKILEIGSGLGGLSGLLPQKCLYLSDIVPEYLAHIKKEYRHQVIHLDISKAVPSKYVGFFDTIFSSNVFEHIRDDDVAFRNCFKLLKKGGKLLLYIPACPEIYGYLDKDMGHYRRYRRDEAINKASAAGFTIVKSYYANLPGYFTWWGRGVLLGRMMKNSKKNAVDSIFAKIFDLAITPLLYLETLLRPQFGQNLVLVAKKP